MSAIPFPIERADQAFLRRFGENANRRIDSQLTRASYLAEDLTASDIVHVIAHLVRRSDVELQTGLALSDAPVWHEDLLDKPTAGIAIIGACASGRQTGALGPPMHPKNTPRFPREEAFISDFFDRLCRPPGVTQTNPMGGTSTTACFEPLLFEAE